MIWDCDKFLINRRKNQAIVIIMATKSEVNLTQ